MGQRKQPKLFRDFTGGLVTDASPLNRPENSTVEEYNFQLNDDGSRQKRWPIDHITSTSYVMTTNQGTDAALEPAKVSYLWKDAGGVSGADKVVVQVGNAVWMLSSDENANLGSLDRYNYKFPTLSSSYTKPYSFAQVDGNLIIATGEGRPKLVTLDVDTDTVSVEDIHIRVRDMFGEKDSYAGFSYASPSSFDDLLSENFVNQRVDTLTRNHEYNLRNQGWGPKRTSYVTGRSSHDPIHLFKLDSGLYPSNADQVTPWLETNPNAGPNSWRIRFNGGNLEANPPENRRAPSGSFVIDLLNRGQSRDEELVRVNTKYGRGTVPGTLSLDRFDGGPSVVAEFAGRIWYAGFTGEVVGGHQHTPYLPSYLAYSQIVEKTSQVGKCFQDGDPTSADKPDLLDTDGGLLRIEDVGEIKSLAKLGDSLAVLSNKGVWLISGGDSIFTANTQLVTKISDKGTSYPSSVVVVNDVAFYWGPDGIYRIGLSQSGKFVSERISEKISSFFEFIKEKYFYGHESEVQGTYDSSTNQLSWLHDNGLVNSSSGWAAEIIYHPKFDCFTYNDYEYDQTSGYKPFMYLPNKGSLSYKEEEEVTDGGITVTDSGVPVTVPLLASYGYSSTKTFLSKFSASASSFELKTAEVKHRISDMADWGYLEYIADMHTAPLSMPDDGRRKTCPYVVFYFDMKRTGVGEEGLIQSSCLVTPHWDWAQPYGFQPTGKRGHEFEAYRNPKNLPDDTFEVLTTRSKVRGRGRNLSFALHVPEGNYLKLYSWGLDIDTNEKL